MVKEVRRERSEDRNQQEKCSSIKRLKRKKHCIKREKLKKSQERSTRTWHGGRVTGNLLLAGVEPQNLEKRGSLSPEFLEGKSSGEPVILWCPKPLTLMPCMRTSLRKLPWQTGRGGKQEDRRYELNPKSRTERKVEAWSRCGVG